MIRPLLFLATFLGFIGPAVAQGIPTNPISRIFQWPDIMAGNDIRADCAPGAPERWRFIYNAIYSEQVRTYDIAGGMVETRVFDRLGIGHMTTFSLSEFFQGAVSAVPIATEDQRRLIAVWESDLPKAVKPVGHLRSDRFFWTTAGCRDGRFVVAAFNYPPDGSTPFDFVPELARFDRSGKPGNPPRQFRDTGPMTDFTQNRHNRDGNARFLLRVDETGIKFGY